MQFLDTDDRPVACLDQPLRGLKLVLVEESDDLREALTLVFRTSGAEVASTATLRDAIPLIRASRPDILVADLPYPFSAECRLLKQERVLDSSAPNSLLGLAFLSGGYADERRAALAAGFTDCLPLPIDPADLVGAVRRLSARLPEAHARV